MGIQSNRRTTEFNSNLHSEQSVFVSITPGTELNPVSRMELNMRVTLNDFWSYAPENKYIFEPTGEMWPSASVNNRFPAIYTDQVADNGKKVKITATEWLSQNRSIEQMIWAPGYPKIIENKVALNDEFVDKNGISIFNQYRDPKFRNGDPNKADVWLNHVREIYPSDADHIIKWLAFKVQNPGIKINHALVLGGNQGVGKDTILEPVVYAVGSWNFVDVTPDQIKGNFNGFVRSVILRVSEARDLGDKERFGFYELMKNYTSSPPNTLRVNEKFIRECYCLNVCGVIMTTNYKSGGIYLPADDRRHYVAWSDKNKEEFNTQYFSEVYKWYANGGIENVSAYLNSIDLFDFDPKAPPSKTSAFWEIVNSGRPPEDDEISTCLEVLGHPDVITLDDLNEIADEHFSTWLTDRRNRRKIPQRLESAGYVSVRSCNAKDGLWAINGKRQAMYAKREMCENNRFRAVYERINLCIK